MKIFTKSQIHYLLKEIEEVAYFPDSFEKFDDPLHPEYELYKDRKEEKAMDYGNNNAVETILMILAKHRIKR